MSNLKKIYAGSFKDRVPHFDDGGYVSYASADPSATYMTGDNSGMPTAADISNQTSDAASIPTGGSTPTTSDVATTMNGGLIPGSEGASTPSGGSSGAISKVLSSLGLGGGNTSNTALLGALTGILSAAGTYSKNKSAATLPSMPALPGFSGSSASGGAGLSSQYGPAGGYNYQNYAGANSSTPGTGYAPRTQAPAKPTASYYTYGQGPEAQVFQQVNPGGGPIAPIQGYARGGSVPELGMGGLMAQPGQTPMTPRPMPAPVQRPTGQQMPQAQGRPQPPRPPSTMMARMQAARPAHMADGGPTPAQGEIPMIKQNQMAQSQVLQTQNPHTMGNQARRAAGVATGIPSGNQPVIQQRATGGALSQANQSRHITGPGDGTSDSIPARLANGEYVIDSQAVSMLGNGDNSAGAKRLDEFRKNLRQHKGGALAKGKMAPDAKPIHKYMGGQ
jgi:hypothetical protein